MNEPTFKMDHVCTLCGRELGREAKSCPRRAEGLCSYPQINKNEGWTSFFFGIIFGMFFMSLGFVALIGSIQEGPIVLALVGLVFLIVGLVVIIAMTTDMITNIYYSQADETTWKQVSFLFFEVEKELEVKTELETVDLEFNPSLTYPASIVALSRLKPIKKIMFKNEHTNLAEAGAIFKIAIISLIARNLVQVTRHRVYKSNRNKPLRRMEDSFGLSTGGEEAEGYLGALEGKILYVLRTKKSQGRSIEEEGIWMDTAPINKLVWSVYDGNRFPAGQWIIDFVAEDAVSKGWATYEGWPTKKFQPVENSLISQQKYVENLSSQLVTKHPYLSKALDTHIKKGIESRTTPDPTPHK